MDQTTGQIEEHIHRERENLGENINELQSKVKKAVDWRTYVRERPFTMVGLAFGAGVVASMFVDGKNGEEYEYSSSGVQRKARREWNVVKSAIGAAILGEAKEFVRELFPRFGREYETREHSTGSMGVGGKGAAEWPSAAEPGSEEL
jgi:hypothetical protein